MKFGMFYEFQCPQPWEEDSELRVIQEALEQVELGDRLGIDYVWEVEHHFLEDYSQSSPPEVFLASAASSWITAQTYPCNGGYAISQ